MDKSNRKNILIDIDGTVSEDIPNEEAERFGDAYVLENAVESVNKLYERGHIITFFTARREEHRKVTEEWLKKHNFMYHNLLMNKPRGVCCVGYVWIDNLDVCGKKYEGNWEKIGRELI